MTSNPWNRKFTSGGSSGGYKPLHGRNPDDPPFNLDFYCHTGPLSRTIGDAILLQNVMSGPHPTDISTLRPKLRLPDQYKPTRKLKVAYSMDLEHLFGAWISGMLEEHKAEMTTYARVFAEKGQKSKATDFVWSPQVAADMYNSFGPMMQKHDIFICPTTALPADFDQSTGEVKINGKIVNPMLGWVMTSPFNTLSRCPVITVPSGHAKNRVPTGIQIVGRTYRDQDVFRAAMAYEKATGP